MDQAFKWYALRAISGKERKGREIILNELKYNNFAHLVKQIVIPTENVIQLKNGKKVTKERNLMPGYILVEANMNADLVSAIAQIPNVINFLGKENPTPLRENEVNKILGKADEMAELGESMATNFIIGETVKVTDGPFNDFSGVIEEVMEDKKKLKVMVKIFGRKTPLELNYMQVEKI